MEKRRQWHASCNHLGSPLISWNYSKGNTRQMNQFDTLDRFQFELCSFSWKFPFIKSRRNGVGTGSPPGFLLACIYFVKHGRSSLNRNHVYARGIDDECVVCDSARNVAKLVNTLNNVHPETKFTVRMEDDNHCFRFIRSLDGFIASLQIDPTYLEIVHHATKQNVAHDIQVHRSLTLQAGIMRSTEPRRTAVILEWSY